MSRERFQAREKKVQKMGRDGLVEHNRATGEEKRVSQRTADAAFDRARSTEREDIRRPAVRGADTGKKRKQPRPAPETRAEQTEVLLTPEYLADATAEPPPDAPATMRGAVDMPLLDAPAAEESTPAPVRKRPQKRGKKGKKKQSTKSTEHAARPDSEKKTVMRGVEGAPAPKRRTSEGGSRLQFDKEEPADPATDRTAIKKRQASKLTEHAAKPDSRETSAMRGADSTPATKRRISESGSRLQFIMLNGEYLNPYFFVDNGDDGTGAIPGTPGGPAIPDYSGEPMGDGSFEAMLHEAEKFLGWPYVWGGSSPSTSFDCSGYVSWVINQSGVGSVGRQTAQGLYNLCTPVSSANAQPGDLIFFTGTYSSPGPVSHVGIYVGGGRFIHCGDPISYANTGSPYWSAHLYRYGRLP